MITPKEIASITVLVPGQQSTNHQIIPFRVYQQQQLYRAIALITNEEIRLAGLPEELVFSFDNNTIVPGKHTKQQHFEVIRNIVQELKIQGVL